LEEAVDCYAASFYLWVGDPASFEYLNTKLTEVDKVSALAYAGDLSFFAFYDV